MPDHYVYFICTAAPHAITGPVKIGVTQDPDARLRAIQTSNAENMAIACVFAFPHKRAAHFFEKLMHSAFADQRLHGEWFDVGPITVVRQACLTLWSLTGSMYPDDEAARFAIMARVGAIAAAEKVNAEASRG